MNLYLISQKIHDDYDTFNCAVVAAKTVPEARKIHPDGRKDWDGVDDDERWSAWVDYKSVTVKLIGISKFKSPGVICASFSAG